MKRLKTLREGAHYSQQDLAGMLKTTQQTIARWEAGKAEPSLSALRDLALIFGTSVDDLLGVNPLSKKVQSTTYHLFGREGRDGFWGHVGLKFGDAPSKWFPVTADTVTKVAGAVAGLDDPDEWVTFSSLANKFVAFRPAMMRKVWLLDDACDQPDADWEVDLPYEGLPLEMYRGFHQLCDVPMHPDNWKSAFKALPKINDRGEAEGGDPAVWNAFIGDLRQGFEGEASPEFIESTAEQYAKEGLYDEEKYFRYMHHTDVYFSDGHYEHFWVEAEDLRSLVFDIESEMVPIMVRLEHFGGSAEPYFPSSKLSALVMPLIDLLDVWKAGEDQSEE